MKNSLRDHLIKVVQTRSRAVAMEYYRVATNMVVPGMSPVWSGQFISSWNITSGLPKKAKKKLTPKEQRAVATSKEPLTPNDARKALPRIKSGDIPFLYVTNTAPYAQEIQDEGTKYSEEDILGRIKDAVRFS